MLYRCHMIIIVDYNASNLISIKKALDYLNIKSKITNNYSDIINAEKIIFPGVGNAKEAMINLKKRSIDLAMKKAFNKKTIILGICLGAQIALSYSEESNTSCLGIIEGFVKKIPNYLKIPHMGWNNINITSNHFLFKNITKKDCFYFAHSYYCCVKQKNIYATTEYSVIFPSVIGENNFVAVQFHPEKSSKSGLKILKNFSEWR